MKLHDTTSKHVYLHYFVQTITTLNIRFSCTVQEAVIVGITICMEIEWCQESLRNKQCKSPDYFAHVVHLSSNCHPSSCINVPLELRHGKRTTLPSVVTSTYDFSDIII